MSRPCLALIDGFSSDEVRGFVREVLEDHFHVRPVPHGAWLPDEPTEALLVCVPAPAPKLCSKILEIRHRSPALPILAVTTCREPEALLEITGAGADDFFTYPGDEVDLLARVWRLAGSSPPGHLPERLRERVALRRLVGRSPAFLELLRRIPLIARTESTVLLLGETGTGKEVVSRAIHYLSPRSESPFVPVNCGALPLDLVENELFGHERAAFTGADRARAGLVAQADGGTLLLDEVDALAPQAQVKLLRLLQEREYRPLGSGRPQPADLRIIAATNADAEQAVEDGRLRPDLYYRLNVLPLYLPALRERRDDIPLLARHFLAEVARTLDRPCPSLSQEATELLEHRDWPGNVRQLRHWMERAVVMADGRGVVFSDDMVSSRPGRPPEPARDRGLSFREAKRRVVERFERGYLTARLREHEGNITQAAKASKKNRRAFWELLRKHEIDASEFRKS